MNINETEQDSYVEVSALKKSKQLCGMSVKKETTFANVLVLFWFPMTAIAVLAFINAQISFILISDTHFNIPQSNIGRATSHVLSVAYFVSIFFTPFAGYIYDLFGRTGPILISLFSNIALLLFIPYSAPRMWLLILARTLISLNFMVLETSPLVVDYIKSESRGTAVALGTIGMLVGEGFGMAVLLGYSIGMEIEAAHSFAASILFVMAVIGVFLIREPTIKEHVRLQDEENLSFCEKCLYLTGQVKEEVLSDAKYIFCFIAVTVIKLLQVLYSVYLMLWILDFVDKGVLVDNDEAKSVYKNILFIGVITVIISLPVLGKLADWLPAHLFAPVSFLIRSVLIIQFDQITDPKSVYSTVICVSVIMASTIQYIVVNSFFMRNLPNAIRGTMLGCFNIFANIGIAAFVFAGGWMFDHLGPTTPFRLVSLCDFLIFLLAVVLICLGYLKS